MSEKEWHPRARLYIPTRTRVKTTKPIRWRDLRIRKGATGEIVRMLEGGLAARIKFDNGIEFDLWKDEFKRI